MFAGVEVRLIQVANKNSKNYLLTTDQDLILDFAYLEGNIILKERNCKFYDLET
jgi:hypothetical protein